ncbi:MAG TPA: protein-L-isoaspartate(D-aspartate) O-methyltransferase [Sphingomicrobium sp.]|nr:protein-L-isoaspartate(D-aspartate) O-methyltransferase [Sphingomicrobium sp.]
MFETKDFARDREAMIDRQLRRRGIRDPQVLEAFARVPREAFVALEYRDSAYGDHPLPIPAGQTISQPYIVALMIEAARIGSQSRVLEVGAGSGYAAAVISRIARDVVAIERYSELAEFARERCSTLGFDNVEIVTGDGTRGCPDKAPFDAILVAASGPEVPGSLVTQLVPGGRLVIPLGTVNGIQQLVRATKCDDGTVTRDSLGAVRFVPLIGQEGWDGDV